MFGFSLALLAIGIALISLGFLRKNRERAGRP